MIHTILVALMFLVLYHETLSYLQATNKNIKRFQYAITIACCTLGFYVLIAYTDGRIKWNTMVESIQEQKREGREDMDDFGKRPL